MSQPIWDSDDVKQIDFFLKSSNSFQNNCVWQFLSWVFFVNKSVFIYTFNFVKIENWYWKLPPLFSSKLQSIAYDAAWLMSVDSSYRTFMCVYLWEVVVSIT